MAGDFGSIRRPLLSQKYSTNQYNIPFMQTDIDYYIGESPSCSDQVPILRIYGVTEEGHSVLAHVYNFEPYF